MSIAAWVVYHGGKLYISRNEEIPIMAQSKDPSRPVSCLLQQPEPDTSEEDARQSEEGIYGKAKNPGVN